MRGSEKSILKKLKKIGHKRFDDHASKLLFKYCLGANSFYHGLGKGLDLPVLKGTRVTRDPIVNNINIAFLKEERGSGIFLPKEERLHRIDVSSYNWFLEKHFNTDDFEIDENILEDEIYNYSVNDNDTQ